MAAPQDISRAQTLISDMLDGAWEAAKPAKKPAFESYMQVDDFGRGEYVDFRHAGVGRFVERDEYEEVDFDELKWGEKLTVKPRNWGRGLMVSEEFLEDIADAGVKDGYNVARLGSYLDTVKRWRYMANVTVEQECADLLLNGTGTTEFTGRDGLSLFNASHTILDDSGTVQTNIDTGGSLSATRIAAMRKMLDTQLDDRGEWMFSDNGYILVHSPENKDRAYELLKTRGKVDTEHNNVNILDQYDITPVEVKYLGASYAGYFLLQEGVHSLTWKWRTKPEFKQYAADDIVARKYRARFRGERFAKDWRGIVANAGS